MSMQVMMMPARLERTIAEALNRVGLTARLIEDATLVCHVQFESGQTLQFVFMVIGQRRWAIFRRIRLSVALLQLGDNHVIQERFAQDWISLPKGPTDLLFSMQLVAVIRAMASTASATSDLGHCVSFGGASEGG